MFQGSLKKDHNLKKRKIYIFIYIPTEQKDPYQPRKKLFWYGFETKNNNYKLIDNRVAKNKLMYIFNINFTCETHIC